MNFSDLKFFIRFKLIVYVVLVLFCYVSVFNYIKVQFPLKLNKTIFNKAFFVYKKASY